MGTTLFNLLSDNNMHILTAAELEEHDRVVVLRKHGVEWDSMAHSLSKVMGTGRPIEFIHYNESIEVADILATFDKNTTLVNVSHGQSRERAILGWAAAYMGFDAIYLSYSEKTSYRLNAKSCAKEGAFLGENTKNKMVSFIEVSPVEFPEMDIHHIIDTTGGDIIQTNSELYSSKEVNIMLDVFFKDNYYIKVKHWLKQTWRYITDPADRVFLGIKTEGMGNFDRGNLYKFLRELERRNCIKALESESGRLVFKCLSGEFRRFITQSGSWLEALTFKTLKEMPNIDDIEGGVQYMWDAGRPDLVNELDVLASKDSRLILISCKDTRNIDTPMLNEIEIYSNNLGGRNALKILIVTTDGPLDGAKARAAEMDINIIEFNGDLRAFKRDLDRTINRESDGLAGTFTKRKMP